MGDRNYGGLGVSFFAKADSAKKEIALLYKKLESIESVLTKIGKVNSLNSLIDAVSLAKLDQLVKKLDSVGDAASSNINLSTSLDSTFASAGKSAAALGANAGLTSKQLRQMKKETAFFYDLNVDSKAVQETWVELERSGLSLQNLGFKNLQEFTKFAEVAGVSGKDLVTNIRLLTKSYGFSETEAKKFLDRSVKIGQELGFADTVMQSMGSTLSTFDDKLRKINPNVTAKEMTELNDQVLLLAGAMIKTGDKPSEAISKATDLFSMLADTRNDFESLAQGVGADLPDMLQRLNLSMGDFGSATELMRANPLDFVKALAANYTNLTDAQKKFVDKNLLQSMNASPDWLIKGNFSKVAGEIDRVQKSLTNAAGSANNLAKAYRTGFTAADMFSRMQEKFNTRLSHMAAASGVQSKFLKLNNKAYKAIGDQLEKWSKDTGPVGAATRAFLAFRVAGIQGVAISIIDSMRQFKFLNAFFDENESKVLGAVGALASFAPQLLAVAAAMKFMGFNFTKFLMGPLGLIGGGAALIYGLIHLEKNFKGGIKGFVDNAEKTIKKNWPKIEKALGAAWTQAVEIAPKIISGLSYMGTKILNGLSGLLDKVDWESLGEKVGGFMGDAFIGAFDFATDILEKMISGPSGDAALADPTKSLAEKTTSRLTDAFAKLGTSTLRALGGSISGMLSKAFQYVADPNMPASKKAEGAGEFVGGALVAGVGLAAMGKLPGGKLAGKAGRGILGGAGKLAAKAGGGSKLKGAGRIAKVAGGVMGAVAIYEQAPSIAKNSAKLINKYGEMSLKEMNDTGFNIASSFTSILNAMFLGIPGMISKSLGIGKKDFQNFYDSLVMQAEGWMLKAIMIFDLAIEGGKYAFERFKITSMEVFWTIAEVGGGALLGVIERFVKGLEIAQGVFNELHKSSKNFFEGFKMGGKMMLLNLTASFTGFKQTVVFDVLAPIVQAIEQFVVSQIITIQKIARKIPRGLLPASAEAFLGMNASEFGFTKGTMFDAKLIEDARKKSSEQLAEERARIVGDYEAAVSANNSAQGVTMASKMAENLSIMQGQLRGVAYYNKRNLESRRADLERNTGANVQGIGSAYLSGVGASEREFNANYLARSNPASVTPVASVKQTRAVAPQAALGVPAADDTPVVEMNRKGFATIASATTESGKAIVDAINRLGKRKEDSEDGGLF